ncbi:unnamed protein product [Calypogeia fissa]
MATVEVVEARAPGKVIISGEHAVVHGTPAVAAALDRYTTVRIKRRPPLVIGDRGVLSVDLPEVKLRLSWPMQYIKQVLDFPWTETDALDTKQIESTKLILEDFVKREVLDTPARAGVAAFLFLYVSIVGLQPLEVSITSELPVGSGLGSSAAFCVAAAAALLTLAGKVELQADELKWMDLDDEGRNLVNTWAFEAEKIIHGRPSGVDNTVSCYGHVVRFKKGHLTRLHSPRQLRMLITNTNVSRNTKALVAGVGELAVRHPTAMAAVFQAIEAISEEIVSILESPISNEIKLEESAAAGETIAAPVHPNGIAVNGSSKVNGSNGHSPIPNSLKALSRLEELMVMNQCLLQCMGVSHPSIDEICGTTSRFHLSSKLTGAGGGGCVLTLLPTGISPAIVQKVETKLEFAGYSCFEAGIGGTGVQVNQSSSPFPDL